ncbi:MAG: relaxase/mobilization nuclease domain-containing protein [Bacteroidota bacterium]
MIGKGKSISHTMASMLYGWNQEKEAEVVHSQYLAGDNPKEITNEFKITQDLNDNCKRNTMSFVISPTIEDGQRLAKQDLEEITQRFIKKMEIGERQAIAFVHRDKQHTHIHLYANRIDFNGKAYKDNFIGKRSQQAAEKVAESMGLTTVREIQKEKSLELKNIRLEMKQIHMRIMNEMKPESFDHYINLMKNENVKVIPTINKSNKLQGFRFEYKDHNLKGSEVHRSMSGGKIGLQISNHNSIGLKIDKDNQIKLLGKTTELSPNIVAALTKKAIKLTIKKSLDIGIGY